MTDYETLILAGENPTETLTPTLTFPPSLTATVTPTHTATASPTAQPAATHTATTVETRTPEVAVTAEVTPDVEITVTETETPVVVETVMTAEPSLTMVVPSEPPLSVLFSDSFDTGLTAAWLAGAGWSLVAVGDGQALQIINTNEEMQLQSEPRLNVAVQVWLVLTAGEFHLHLRQSVIGDYTVAVDADGTVRLSRAGVQVATAAIAANGGEHILRVSAIEGVIRVVVDGVEVITWVDGAPLPPGTVAFGSQFPSLAADAPGAQHRLVVDDFVLAIPTNEFVMLPTASPMPSATVGLPTPATSPTPRAEPLPPEPPLLPIFTENFDGGPSMLWMLGEGWSYVPHEGGLALAGTISGEPVTFANSDIRDAAVEARFQIHAGAAQISTWVSAAGRYTASLDLHGQVNLYRGEALLRSVTIVPLTPGEWYTLRLSAFGDTIRVTVDGVEVIAVRDPQPLSAGAALFGWAEDTDGKLLVDNFVLAIQTSYETLESAPAFTRTPTLTPTRAQPGDRFPVFLDDFAALEFDLFENAVVVTANNEMELRNEILNANNNCTATPATIIELPSQIYTVLSSWETFAPSGQDFGAVGLPVIRCAIMLRGTYAQGITTIQRSAIGADFRILAVDETATLTLDHVKITNGSASATGGSGIFSYRGDVNIINNSEIVDNEIKATAFGPDNLGAGVYVFQASLTIADSLIAGNHNNNTIGRGGGIALLDAVGQITNTIIVSNTGRFGAGIAAVGNSNLFISNSTIKNNISREDGGGIYLEDNAQMTVLESLLKDNTAMVPGSGGAIWFDGFEGSISESCIIGNSHYSVHAPAPSLWATRNWWGAVDGPSGDGGGSGDSIGQYVIVNTDFITTPPANPDVDCLLGFPDPTPTPTPTPTLADFGVATVGWTPPEEQIILIGVERVAQAFANQSGRPLLDAWDTVMRRDGIDPATGIFLTFRKAGSGATCDASAVIEIVCGTGINLTDYTVVHELGHIFDNRSNQNGQISLEQYIESTRISVPGIGFNRITDNQGELVTGVFHDVNSGQDIWDRGPRGWGSGPASEYLDNDLFQPTQRILTDFQQNAPPYLGDGNLSPQQQANKETAADMFLNWVYDAFQDKSWVSSPKIMYQVE